jgi:CheY-like chemotaxis protein
VIDDGEGMDEETLGHAIEPFFTTKGVGKGTGLGLSMVQGLAEQSGGQLTISSQKGKGTTVELLLPAGERPAAASKAAHQKESLPALSQRLKILAVDDDSLVLMNTVAMLEDLGHTVEQASSGVQALKILQNVEALDLVLTDQAMPHMTGLELIEALKRERPELPVIIATGYSELPPTIERVTRLAKPYFQEDLRNAIARATSKTPS